MWPCFTRDAMVLINKYDCGIVDGYLIHPRLGNPRPIKSISHLLRLFDQAQNLENIPYRPEPMAGSGYEKSNRLATFTIQILFQQNHTIQGRLIWHEESSEAVFSSALELIYLMDDILAGKTNLERS